MQRDGHATVSVYMMAQDAPGVVRFMCEVFGAQVLMRHDREDGSVMHASVRIGDSVVMVADGTADYPAFPVWLHVYVEDVDAVHRRALAADASEVEAPADKPDGDRRGGVRDPAGNIWWIATAKG